MQPPGLQVESWILLLDGEFWVYTASPESHLSLFAYPLYMPGTIPAWGKMSPVELTCCPGRLLSGAFCFQHNR